MFFELPPAGEYIGATRTTSTPLARACFPEDRVRFFRTGTAALAAAVRAAMSGTNAGRNRAEVILPAYTCPALVSAILHVGARPVLVDFVPRMPWLDIRAVVEAINNNTVAVIAVNFLGIRERIKEIRDAISGSGVCLIEDNCQAFDCNREVVGDYAVYSFGRGKPVSILLGGAVLARDVGLAGRITAAAGVRDWYGVAGHRLKIAVYNHFRKPAMYGILSNIPLLGIGETRYVPLRAIEGLTNEYVSLLEENIKRHLSNRPYIEGVFHSVISRVPSDKVVDLAREAGNAGKKLLRFPILLESKVMRDEFLSTCRRSGLGVSRMYPSILTKIGGLADVCGPGAYYNAESFCERLVTLPTHSGVTVDVIRGIEESLISIALNTS